MKQKIAVSALVLLAVIIGTTIREKMPTPMSVYEQPYEFSKQAPRFGTVDNVVATTAPTYEGMTTRETFLVVNFDITTNAARKNPVATLMDGKDRSVRSVTLTRCGPVQVGITAHCEVGFEVQREAVAGSVLRLSPGFSEAGNAVLVHPLDVKG
ncbi:hypothetical protein [Corynebacterium epidermidicanis]|uniref:Uncharacterized protein n=1 Tax=Corynebacterium epidermidicanis TaxID=1050174 RepID=A0A0G3GQN9_9CORY|nr:hypothetical protein [Corynebacterium epidermidicanis]AKK02875.1 hypothetical protein CEPID_05030 [Corynebacterium epidermidicanis]